MYLRRNDLVVVISGVHRGKQGRVLRVDRGKQQKNDQRGQDQVFVQGLNLRFKHIRRSQKNPQGGRIQKEAAIPACKLQLVDPKSNRPTRVGYRIENGKKIRFSKRSGEPI